MSEQVVHLGLGSNLGDRRAHLDSAVAALGDLGSVLAVSDYVETAPVGDVEQRNFLNAAAALRTRLAPRALLEECMAIERRCGRDRREEARWGPRTLDIDLLLMGDLVVDEPGLVIPHPNMHERAFVLGPLAQIAPDAMHPVRGECVARLRADLEEVLWYPPGPASEPVTPSAHAKDHP